MTVEAVMYMSLTVTGFSNMVLAGLNGNIDVFRSELTIWSREEDVDILKDLRDECQVKSVHVDHDVEGHREVYLTPKDIETLQQCPLKTMYLSGTYCFQPSSRIDLSVLSGLEELYISGCGHNTTFVITGLPDSLREVVIENLSENNFELGNTGFKMEDRDGDSVMLVTNASMYCPGATFGNVKIQYRMYQHLDRTPGCEYLTVLSILIIRQEDDLLVLRESRQQMEGECQVQDIDVIDTYHLYLTQQDIEILQKCPLKKMRSHDNICFPPQARINLSGLTGLEKLSITNCRNNDFVITGFPNSLETLYIWGLSEVNFDIDHSGERFGDNLQFIEVDKQPNLCCPGVIYGAEVPPVECRYREMKTITLVSCGFSHQDSKLGIFTPDQVDLLMNLEMGKCNLSEVVVVLPDLMLTEVELAVLETCPLTSLILHESSCFSSPSVDLSVLTHLKFLAIHFCRNSDFVITKLPAAIEKIEIIGLVEFNIRLHNHSTGFGDNVRHLIVYNPAMCCRSTLYRMFARDLSAQCYHMLAHYQGQFLGIMDQLDDWSIDISKTVGNSCGFDSVKVVWWSNNGLHLALDNRSQLQAITGGNNIECQHGDYHKKSDSQVNVCEETDVELTENCHMRDNGTEMIDSGTVQRFFGSGPDFYLTQKDVDYLSKCPQLLHMILPYTSCFSGTIDLSFLSQLEILSLPHCTNLNFTIIGLPSTLKNLDIRGMDTDNIKFGNSSFGASLQKLQVSKPTTCQCPQASIRMFGRPLAETTTCGITETTHSSRNDREWAFMDLSLRLTADDFDTAISSCENLIEDLTLRYLLWTMACFATVGNAAVLVYRLGWDRQSLQKSHGIYPLNLAVSDLFMGVYLFIIADADLRFRGEYVLFDEDWRLCPVCHIAGFFCSLSSEASVIFILLITVDRFLAIRFPFGQYRISLNQAWIMCGVAWLTSLSVASLPVIMPNWEVYSHNSICVGLPLNANVYHGSGYTTGIFIGVNSVLFLLIAIGQASIYFAMWVNSKESSLNNKQAKRRYKRDMAVARQLSLIVITDFFCWFPICIMGLMAQTGQLIPDAAYAWSAVVVLPINSSINPMLYTLRHVILDVVKKINLSMTKESENKKT